MVNVKVKFLSMVRDRTGIFRAEYRTSSAKLSEAVREIASEFGVEDLVLLDNGMIRPWARVMLNGRSQDFSLDKSANATIRDGDVIALLYSFPYHENV